MFYGSVRDRNMKNKKKSEAKIFPRMFPLSLQMTNVGWWDLLCDDTRSLVFNGNSWIRHNPPFTNRATICFIYPHVVEWKWLTLNAEWKRRRVKRMFKFILIGLAYIKQYLALSPALLSLFIQLLSWRRKKRRRSAKGINKVVVEGILLLHKF